VYLDIMQARFQFYFQTHERVLQAADGLIDFTHIGEDLGTQTGPLVGMDIFDKHFAPRYEEYFKMAHSYGARSIMHMCGTVHPFLRRLIDIGLDIYDVVQPTTPDNDVCALRLKFGQDLAYRGSMDVQKELVFGTVEDVEREVQRRLEAFPLGGLILGPSHAIQVKSPIANILAMYRRAGSLLEPIPEWVYDVSGAEDDGIDLSKLY
jgi:uroporphyrinogen-III decarboxylase